MIKSKTLFVVGAGASKEAGLPTGKELKSVIADMVNIKFGEFGTSQIGGDHEIVGALRENLRLADDSRGDINPYLHAGWRIHDALPQAISIDNFIDSHQGNERIKLVGKLAIVRSILESERNSKIYFDSFRSNDSINFGELDGTWYNSFMQVLTQEARVEDLPERLENLSFVIFNYDRCVEHMMFLWLKNYYGLNDDDVKEILSPLRVVHPYGQVGYLPWQKNKDNTEFGGGSYGNQLLSHARQIKTFTERVEDKETLMDMRQLVQDAETIVFLGFAFHRQNMTLIKPENLTRTKQVFATAKGISDSDSDVVRKSVYDLLEKKSKDTRLEFRNKLTCYELFNEYWRNFSL